MNKHAYMITAFGNWKVLERLLLLLDDVRNDIYLHIDARANDFPREMIHQIRYSKVTFVDPVKVYWADFSFVEAILRLMKAAKSNGEGYSYYHLLSGVDMPLKSTDEIYNFYETSGKEFIAITPHESYFYVRRIKFYHPFLHNRFYRKSKPLKAFVRLLEYGQLICGVNRLRGKLWNKSWKIIAGRTWFSVTDQFCEYVLQQEDVIRKHFSSSIAADEIFIQTLAYNSDFINNIYDMNDELLGFMHYIINTGHPYVWGQDPGDFEKLMESPYMFARKFNEQHFEIVEKIYRELDRRNKAEKSLDFEAKK